MESAVLTPAGLRLPREDLARLLAEQLQSLGYARTAELLQQESATRLDEDKAAAGIRRLALESEDPWAELSALARSVRLIREAGRPLLLALIAEQRYRELLEAGRIPLAIECLQTELRPLLAGPDPGKLARLSSFLLSAPIGPEGFGLIPKPSLGSAAHAFNQRGLFEGGRGSSEPGWRPPPRSTFFDLLSTFIPPDLMVPPNHLLRILDGALAPRPSAEAQALVSRPPAGLVPLLGSGGRAARISPCSADAQLRLRPVCSLQTHSREVNDVRFSPDGRLLSSVSADGSCIIWKLGLRGRGRLSKSLVLSPFQDGSEVIAVAWSPDSSRIALAGSDQSIGIWNTSTGNLEKSLVTEGFSELWTCLAWCAEGRIAAGCEGKLLVLFDEQSGREVYRWEGLNVCDIAPVNGGSHFVAVTAKPACVSRRNAAELHERFPVQARSRVWLFGVETKSRSPIDPVSRPEQPAAAGPFSSRSSAAPALASSSAEEARPLSPRDSMEPVSVVARRAPSGATEILLSCVGPDPHLRLWTLEASVFRGPRSSGSEPVRCQASPVVFRGFDQQRYVLRPSFLGEGHVAVGSEDSMVCVWKRNSAAAVLRLEGHTGAVNALASVSLSDVEGASNRHRSEGVGLVLVSASDDATAMVWASAGNLENDE